jgi:hypothetical protein
MRSSTKGGGLGLAVLYFAGAFGFLAGANAGVRDASLSELLRVRNVLHEIPTQVRGAWRQEDTLAGDMLAESLGSFLEFFVGVAWQTFFVGYEYGPKLGADLSALLVLSPAIVAGVGLPAWRLWKGHRRGHH